MTTLKREFVQAYAENGGDSSDRAPSRVSTRSGLDPTERLRRDSEPFGEGSLGDARLVAARA
jgi:hypothetical protein